MSTSLVRWSSAAVGALGGLLFLLGALGVLFGVVALVDPQGAQMANDADPFGKPPTTVETSVQIAAFTVMSIVGGWLFRWAHRKGAAQQAVPADGPASRARG